MVNSLVAILRDRGTSHWRPREPPCDLGAGALPVGRRVYSRLRDRSIDRRPEDHPPTKDRTQSMVTEAPRMPAEPPTTDLTPPGPTAPFDAAMARSRSIAAHDAEGPDYATLRGLAMGRIAAAADAGLTTALVDLKALGATDHRRVTLLMAELTTLGYSISRQATGAYIGFPGTDRVSIGW